MGRFPASEPDDVASAGHTVTRSVSNDEGFKIGRESSGPHEANWIAVPRDGDSWVIWHLDALLKPHRTEQCLWTSLDDAGRGRGQSRQGDAGVRTPRKEKGEDRRLRYRHLHTCCRSMGQRSTCRRCSQCDCSSGCHWRP